MSQESHTLASHLYSDLRSLANASFPKRCATCGREYANAEAFIAATQPVRPDHSGLKESLDDDEQPIVDLFRNCACGSTLLESFHCRRDTSAAGLQRRARFEQLLQKLVTAGIPASKAKAELIKLMHGQPSQLLQTISKLKNQD